MIHFRSCGGIKGAAQNTIPVVIGVAKVVRKIISTLNKKCLVWLSESNCKKIGWHLVEQQIYQVHADKESLKFV